MSIARVLILLLLLSTVIIGCRGPVREAIRERNAEPVTPVAASENVSQNLSYNAGYAVVDGLHVWYPTTQEESSFAYGRATSTIAHNAPIANGTFPAVVFSHGYRGCGTQSLFLTEELARAGYIVIAPDHNDASCAEDAAPGESPDFYRPDTWTDEKFADRGQDIVEILDLLGNATAPPLVAADEQRIGIVGHSLGGYTAFGMAGAWPSWKDERIDAAVLLSPYAEPYSVSGDLGNVDIPVMIQGGTLDREITPRLDPIYDALAGPKYFLVLSRAGHLAWTNLDCRSYEATAACVAEEQNPRLIASYTRAFLDRHVKGTGDELTQDPGLRSYRAG